IREMPGVCTLLMLSSADQADGSARCKELGVTAYLTKPVKQSSLFDAIVDCLICATRSASDASMIAERAQSTMASRRPLKILLAEDSVVNQKLVVGLLKRSGHE